MKRFNAVSLIAAVFLLTSVTAYGDTLSTWVGFNSPTPVWSHPENWSPPVVPNNSPGTGYDARNVNAEVDISPTVNSLTAAQLWGPPSGPAPILTVINDATVTGGLLFAPGFGSPFFPGPTGPASLSVGGDLNLMGSATIVNGSLKVKGNFTISSPFSSPSPFTALYPLNNNDEFRVGGTLTNQAGNLLLGNGRCFGPFQSCPAVVYPAPIPLGVSGPPTSVGALVNNGQIYSWSDVHASTVTNNGTVSQLQGSLDVGTLRNAGTVYLSNSCCSIAPEATASLNYGALDELLSSDSSYGQIVYSSWLEPCFGCPSGPFTPAGYSVNLNGKLDIMFQNGFTPSIGDSFTILTFGPGKLNGTFSNVSWDSFDNGLGSFKVSYDNAAGNVVITAEAVPEPSTILLLAGGLGLMVFWISVRRGGVGTISHRTS